METAVCAFSGGFYDLRVFPVFVMLSLAHCLYLPLSLSLSLSLSLYHTLLRMKSASFGCVVVPFGRNYICLRNVCL